MTIATDLGFKTGELYCVQSGYHPKGMIVEFLADDASACPWFQVVSDEPKSYDIGAVIGIRLENLVPVTPTNTSPNKPLLLLYIQQQYPDDKVLKALVESL